MARTYSRPWRTLGVLGALIALLYGLVAGGVIWSTAQWTPKLALDLDGGTEFVLNAVPQPGQSGQITPATIDEALKIIRARVDGSGVAEAEITTQGSNSIVVSLPGKNIDETTRNAIRRSAALEFRAVLVLEGAPVPEPTPSGTPTATPTGSASGSPSASASGSPSVGAAVSGSSSDPSVSVSSSATVAPD